MEEKYTVKSALRFIVDRESWAVFQNEVVINGMLADLAAQDAKARQRIRLALFTGAGKMFYGMLSKNGGSLPRHDLMMLRSSLMDAGFDAAFTQDVLNTFLYAVSLPEVRLEDPDPKPGPDPGPRRVPGPGPGPGTLGGGGTKKQPPNGSFSLNEILDLANGYMTQNDYQRAIYMLESVIPTYPGCAEIYNTLGIAYRCTGRPDKALAYYDRALWLDPGNGNTMGNKAIALANGGRAKESLGVFQKSLRILFEQKSNHYVRVLGNYAYALAQCGDRQGAAQAYHESARLGYANAKEMGVLLRGLGVEV